MLLSDLKNKTILRSGQYIVGDLAAFNMTMDDFWNAVQTDIEFYQRFFPVRKHFNVFAPASFAYDFTADPNNAGYVVPTTPPVITNVGTAGSSIWSYYVAAYDNVGQLLSVTSSGLTATGNATLTSGNYNSITWTAITNQSPGGLSIPATTYSVWRISSSLTQLNGKIASGLTGTNLHDTGLSGDGTAVPQANGIPPERITTCIPIGTMQVISVLSYWSSPLTRDIFSPNRIVTPRTFLQRYDKPVLRYSEAGVFDIRAEYFYPLIKTYDAENNLVDIDIPEIEAESTYYLLNLFVARWLQVVGRARRAFTYQDLPITTDADSLVKEGEALEQTAKEEIYRRCRWYDSLRP